MVSLNFFPPFDQLTPLFPFFTNNFDVCLHISKTCRIQIFLLRFHSIPSEFEFFNFIVHIIDVYTGKSLSEALIFASTNPQYDNIELQVQYMKIPSSNLGRSCCVQKLFLTFRTIFVHNMCSATVS